jgi:hypothetical protein
MSFGVLTSSLKMETVCFCETLVSTYKPKWRYNPEEQHRHEVKMAEYRMLGRIFAKKKGCRRRMKKTKQQGTSHFAIFTLQIKASKISSACSTHVI